uniref:Glycine cleavage system H protein n=1 Tax=Wollemia nobilis TaxID=56998 RepID=A0A0C9RP73_9CONI
MALRVWASQAANTLRIGCKRPPLSFGFPTIPLSRGFAHVIEGLKYAESHEWVKPEGEVGTVGITHHAQDHLGEVVFVDLPEVGAAVSKGGSFGAVESVKATSDINAPVSGEIVEVNSKLSETPGLINGSPYEEGWIIKVRMKDLSEMDKLMNTEQYTRFCEEEDASH